MGIHEKIAVRIALGTVLSIVGLAPTGDAVAAAPPNLDRTLAAQLALVAEQPYDAAAHNDLGNLLVLDGRYQEAEDAYSKAIELAPASTLPRFNLGMLLQQTGRARDATQAFRGLLEIDDRHARTYYQLGMLHEARRQRSAALESYARAFALDPELTFPRNNPHILDNRLATEAMLMSKQFSDSPSTTMPRLYGEPERIAELMLEGTGESAAPAAAAGEPAAEDGSEPEAILERDERLERQALRLRQREAAEAPPEEEAESEDTGQDDEDSEDEDRALAEDGDGARRQLTHADLQTGSTVGQAQPQGGGIGGPPPRARRTAPAARERIVRPPGAADPGGSTATGRTPGPRPRYRPPSRFSTGRLELRLLPEEPGEGVAGG